MCSWPGPVSASMANIGQERTIITVKFVQFYVFFLYPIAAIFSMVFGRLFGFDRRVEKRKFQAEWSSFELRDIARKLLVAIAFLGFLFPVLYPLYALTIALFSLLAFSVG